MYLPFRKIVCKTMVKVISHVIPERQSVLFGLMPFVALSVEQLPRWRSDKIKDYLIFMQYLD
jgi:hypothetical protein